MSSKISPRGSMTNPWMITVMILAVTAAIMPISYARMRPTPTPKPTATPTPTPIPIATPTPTPPPRPTPTPTPVSSLLTPFSRWVEKRDKTVTPLKRGYSDVTGWSWVTKKKLKIQVWLSVCVVYLKRVGPKIYQWEWLKHLNHLGGVYNSVL